jgi:hypothetical protein
MPLIESLGASLPLVLLFCGVLAVSTAAAVIAILADY